MLTNFEQKGRKMAKKKWEDMNTLERIVDSADWLKCMGVVFGAINMTNGLISLTQKQADLLASFCV